MDHKSLTAERLREILHYDPDAGVWRWREKRGCKRKGAPAGCFNAGGYRVIRIDKCLLRSGRLAWLYTTGEWPQDEIDHRDGDPSNDRWDNLRQATREQNMWNKKHWRTSRNGLKGISWHPKIRRWIAEIGAREGRKYLGCFATAEEAAAAYREAARQHYGEFARF